MFDHDAELFECSSDEIEMVGERLLNADLPAGDRAEREKRDDLVIIGIHCHTTAVELSDPFDT